MLMQRVFSCKHRTCKYSTCGKLTYNFAWEVIANRAVNIENACMQLNPLTPEEEDILVRRGTEAPFSGEYENEFRTGTYICRRCNAELYRSDAKFHSGCGWPSFDQEITGAVRRLADPDGRRVEIRCANCDGHLGHVFEGEGFTAKNTRHCVNSLSMKFIATA